MYSLNLVILLHQRCLDILLLFSRLSLYVITIFLWSTHYLAAYIMYAKVAKKVEMIKIRLQISIFVSTVVCVLLRELRRSLQMR